MDGLDAASVKAAVEATAARRDRPPDDRADRHQLRATSTRRFAPHEPAADRGHRAPPRRRARAGALLVAQSFAGWPYARTGGPVKTEADPLDPDPPKGIRETHAAIRRLEELVTEAGGIVLRYGGFYGPGTGMAPGGDQLRDDPQAPVPARRQRRRIWSFLHTDDIATATLAAIEHGRPGEIYNIVDDEPAPATEWLPYLAERSAPSRRARCRRGSAQLVASPAAVAMMTEARGASNAKAKAELGWTPACRAGARASPPLGPSMPDRRVIRCPRARVGGSAGPCR